MSLSTLYSLPTVEEKIAQIDAEIAALEDELAGHRSTGRSRPQIEALLAVAKRKKRWYTARIAYLGRSAA